MKTALSALLPWWDSAKNLSMNGSTSQFEKTELDWVLLRGQLWASPSFNTGLDIEMNSYISNRYWVEPEVGFFLSGGLL